MRAVALNDADTSAAALVVDTSAGRLAGTWRGGTMVRSGDIIDVELELARPRRWDELVAGRSGAAVPGPGSAPLRAEVLAFADGALLVQIGEATALLELIGDPPVDSVGTVVLIPAGDLEFFPTGV